MDSLEKQFADNIDFSVICNKQQLTYEQCVNQYIKYLLKNKKINIEYLLYNFNDSFSWERLIDELLKNDLKEQKILRKIAKTLACEISIKPQILLPSYINSKSYMPCTEKYDTPLDIFTSSSYFHCRQECFLLIRKIYELDHSLFFSLLEQLRSKYLIQEFILSYIVNIEECDKLYNIIEEIPSVITSVSSEWNRKISIFTLLSTVFEKLKKMLVRSKNDNEVKPIVIEICKKLCARSDKFVVVYSFSAFLIRMLYFPCTELDTERKACSEIASIFLDCFAEHMTANISIEEIHKCLTKESFYIDNENVLKKFKESGCLSENNKNISGFYSILVFIALSSCPNESNDDIVQDFEYLLSQKDNFYYTLSKNNGDLSCYHFYIASVYASCANPVQRWFDTHKLLEQLINRWHFNFFSTSANDELNVISFFLHVGIALVDILAASEIKSHVKNYQSVIDCIWDDYKNLIISVGDAYWADFHVTVTYLYIFMCRIIDFESAENLNWLYSKLSDLHAFPGLQLQILSNMELNNFDQHHIIRQHKLIKQEFSNAISSLWEYSQLLCMDQRVNQYEFTDRDINVYNAFVDKLNKI